MNGVGGNVLIAIISVVLGAPFLNFLLSLTRAKVDRNNVIVTGAGSTVTAMGQAVEALRRELEEVREDLSEARAELVTQSVNHQAQMARMRVEHKAEMLDLREQRDSMRKMIRNLEARLPPPEPS